MAERQSQSQRLSLPRSDLLSFPRKESRQRKRAALPAGAETLGFRGLLVSWWGLWFCWDSAVTGSTGHDLAGGMGFGVRPMMAGGLLVRASAVTGSGGHDIAPSCFRGGRGGPRASVLGCFDPDYLSSQNRLALRSNGGHRAHHETSTVPLPCAFAPVAAAARRAWAYAIMQRHHESNTTRENVAVRTGTGRIPAEPRTPPRNHQQPATLFGSAPAGKAVRFLGLLSFRTKESRSLRRSESL